MRTDPPSLKRAAAIALGSAVAAFLLWLSVVSNIERACVLGDTPYLSLCPPPPAAGSPEHLRILRERIGANPGDSAAYAELARALGGLASQQPLRAASTLAPNDPNVVWARALLALQQERLPEAVTDLVQLTQHYFHLTQQPAELLARLIAMGQGALLEPHLTPGSRWFPLVLAEMVRLKLPIPSALPLISRAAANGILPPERLLPIVRDLKASGNWVDAYGLWLGQHEGRLPVLYNGGFERSFQPDGFDWEVMPAPPSRAGALVTRRPMGGRGHVMEVEYTGRSGANPVLRQLVYLAAGSYRLTGSYMTSRLQTENGLAWSVRCVQQVASAQPIGRSSALGASERVWRPFAFDFIVPEGCGAVASLQLESFAAYEAAAGIRGRAAFDDLSLQRNVP